MRKCTSYVNIYIETFYTPSPCWCFQEENADSEKVRKKAKTRNRYNCDTVLFKHYLPNRTNAPPFISLVT